MSGTVGDNVYRASGVTAAAGGGGAWNFISATALDTTTVLVTGLDSTYEIYQFVFEGLHCDTTGSSNNLQAQLYQGGAAVTTSSYNWAMTNMGDWQSSVTCSYSASDTNWRFCHDGTKNTTAAVIDCILYLFNPSSTTVWPSLLYSKMGETHDNRTQVNYGGGQFQGTGTATTGLQFACAEGGFNGGTVRLYGLSKS